MRKPAPLPTSVTAADRVAAIRARHRDDPTFAAFPDPSDLHGVIRYALDHHTAIPRGDRQADLVDVLMLTRLAELERDRLILRALHTARKAGLKPRILGPALGLRSRQGIRDRIDALTGKVAAARYGVEESALAEEPDVVQTARTDLHAFARRLLAHWGELATTADIDIWEEGIRLVVDDPDRTAAADASLAVQIRAAAQEIDQHAAATGHPAAHTAEAALLLQTARALR